MRSEFDVIIVGGGGSGLAAAVSAAENDLNVLVLEKRGVLGGTTGLAVGSMTVAGTQLQRSAGIVDTLESHLADVPQFASSEIEARNNDTLRRFHLAESANTYRWLTDMGLTFHGPSPEPPNRVPRMHNAVPNGKAYIAVLQSRLLALNGTIHCSAPVTKLIQEGGRVRGVEAQMSGAAISFTATRGVVLAAGDYANSKTIIAENKGAAYSLVDGINPHAEGDGHRLAAAAGGELLNMDVTWGPEIRFVPPEREPFVRLLPTRGFGVRCVGWLFPWVPRVIIHAYIKRLLVTWQHPDDGIYQAGAILVNREGKRFCNERVSPERELALARQTGGVGYLLLDQRLVQRYSEWPHFVSTAPEIAYAYVADYLRLRPDISVSARSLAEIARARGMEETNLDQAVAQFNRYVAGSEADAQGRTGDLHPLEGSNWVLLGPAKAYFTITEGGARVNQDLQVLDHSGEPITGLYAVGCNGLGGQVLFSHGLHIGWAMTSGRLVGKVLSDRKS